MHDIETIDAAFACDERATGTRSGHRRGQQGRADQLFRRARRRWFPSVLKVNVEDMQRVLAESRLAGT
jgi:hypothetical protein